MEWTEEETGRFRGKIVREGIEVREEEECAMNRIEGKGRKGRDDNGGRER